MIHHLPPDDSSQVSMVKTTAVAIDKDKNSPHAVRWAMDHVAANKSNSLTVVHVRHKGSIQHLMQIRAEVIMENQAITLMMPMT